MLTIDLLPMETTKDSPLLLRVKTDTWSFRLIVSDGVRDVACLHPGGYGESWYGGTPPLEAVQRLLQNLATAVNGPGGSNG